MPGCCLLIEASPSLSPKHTCAGRLAQASAAHQGHALCGVLCAAQVPLLVLSKTTKYLCVTAENIVQVRVCSCHKAMLHVSQFADVSMLSTAWLLQVIKCD